MGMRWWRREVRRGALVVTALAFGCSEPEQAAPSATGSSEPPVPLAWGDHFDPGPFPVGFRSTTLSRTATDGRDRTLTVSIWYPALAGTGTPVRLDDLLAITLAEGQLQEAEGLPQDKALSAALTGDSLTIVPARADAALSSRTFASWDSEPSAGSFPLVLWSARHATVLAQAPLSEVLASHGMVVTTVWSSDPPLAFIWEDHPDSLKRATIETHTGDLTHVLATLAADPQVETEAIVVLAWSYGGQSASLLQERVDAVTAVVGLDANVVPARPEEELRLRRPFVWLLGGQTGGRGFEERDDLTAPTMIVRFPDLAHGTFNAMEGFLPALYGAETVYPWSQGGPEAMEGYSSIVRTVVEAVTWYGGQGPGSMALLRERVEAATNDGTVELTVLRD